MARREQLPRADQPLPGLYRNGARWWIRTVRAPLSDHTKPMSTGTTDVAIANRIKSMVDDFPPNPSQFGWVELAVAGQIGLDLLHRNHAAGTLDRLRKQLSRGSK